jgi:hypothetical protein
MSDAEEQEQETEALPPPRKIQDAALDIQYASWGTNSTFFLCCLTIWLQYRLLYAELNFSWDVSTCCVNIRLVVQVQLAY